VVEIIDRVLQLLEHAFVPLAVLGDVADGPERRGPAAGAGDRPHPQAVPAELTAAAERRAEPQLLGRGAPLARRLGQAIHGLRDFRTTREQALDRLRLGALLGAREAQVPLVRVDDAAGILDNQEPVGGRVGHDLREVVARAGPGKAHGPDRDREHKEHADHGEHGQKAEDHRLGLLVGHEAEAREGGDEDPAQREQKPDIAGALGAIDRRSVGDLRGLGHVVRRHSRTRLGYDARRFSRKTKPITSATAL
jgi:hypothetical protein